MFTPVPTVDFHGQPVSKIGLGLMSVVDSVYKTDLSEVSKTLDLALSRSLSFWDTADVYGSGESERIASNWLKGDQRDLVFLCTKFALKSGAAPNTYDVRGDPAYAKASCMASLERLGIDCIDLYYQHRVDPNTPIEDTVRAMKELQDAGKIKHIGLSECSAETLRRAAKVAKIAAVQVEYSVFTPDIETNGLLDACRELGVMIVCYSPLGRGLLTTKWTSEADIPADDFRKTVPRWQGEAFKANLRFIDAFKQIASAKSCSPAQLALAWLMAQPQCIPIVGTGKVHHLEDNLGAVNLVLSADDLKRIRGLMQTVRVEGTRYAANMMQQLDF